MPEFDQEALVLRPEPAELVVALPFDITSLAENIRHSASMIDELQDASEADLAAERERMRQVRAATHEAIERGLSLQTEQKDTYLLLQDEIEAYVALRRVQAEAIDTRAAKEAQLEEKRLAQHDQSVEARQISQQKQAADAEKSHIDQVIRRHSDARWPGQPAEVERLPRIWADERRIAEREDQLRSVLHTTAVEIGTLEEEIATIAQHELPELEIEIDKRQAAIQTLMQKIYSLSAQIERLQPPAKDPAKQRLFTAKMVSQSAEVPVADMAAAEVVVAQNPSSRHPRALGKRAMSLVFEHKPDGGLSRAIVKTTFEEVRQ